MQILGVLGLILAVVGGVWLLITAFRVSALWALACFIPFGGLIFVALHWEESKGAFLTGLAGAALIFFGK
jgi:hypothetical protein